MSGSTSGAFTCFGVNISGGEFGSNVPGTLETDYMGASSSTMTRQTIPHRASAPPPLITIADFREGVDGLSIASPANLSPVWAG
jgi:hypothetical protein